MTVSQTQAADRRPPSRHVEPPAPADLGGPDRRDRRRGRPARLGHPRLVLEPLGHDHRDLGGLRVAGVALKTVQTTLTAFAWYSILRYAYPTTSFKVVLACYATSVALNGFLPANIGTFVMLLMFTTIIAGATFSGVLGAYVVEKIFFTLIGAFTYLYLFLSVGGSFDIKFAFVHERPWATAILLLGGAFLIYLLIRAFWPKIVQLVGRRQGGRRHPRASRGSTSSASSLRRCSAGSRASA